MTVSPAEQRAVTGRAGRKATIAQIAHEAGVSAPTVSKVLNGRSDVAPETRQRVEELILRHGYRRRRSASNGPAPMLDLVFHELDSPWAMEIIRGVETVAAQQGLSVVLSECRDHQTPGESWLNGVLARRPTGVILVLSDLDREQRCQLTARGIPFVVVDPAGDPGDDVPAIGAANWSGGLAATRHLIELGHRRIGMVGGPTTMMCSRARIDGYRAALDAAGIPIDQSLIRNGDFHVEGGYHNGAALLALAEPPTAVFAGSDLQAMGVYEAARQSGLRVPDDLSVIGFDDLPVARWIGPPLTTIRQPLTEMAEAAARLVAATRNSERTGHHQRLDLATSLVVRASTAPPRERPRGRGRRGGGGA